MSKKVDLTGREFGRLTVVRYAGSWRASREGKVHGHWKADCSCGGSVVVATHNLTGGRVWHCDECDPASRHRDYMAEYKDYRSRFTDEQRRYYDHLMRNRSGWRAEAEAVDVVMRGIETRSAA